MINPLSANHNCSSKKKLEMCQYDTDAATQDHPHPHAGIL